MALNSDSPDVAGLIGQLKALKPPAIQDELLRKELYKTVNDVSLSIESHRDSVLRIIYSPLQMTIAKIASDLDLFEILVKIGPASATTLAAETKSDVALLRRILRCLASLGMIQETEEDHYAATNISKSLNIPGFKAGLYHNFEAVSPALYSLPKFLSDTKYENPADSTHCSFQLGHNTELPAFVYAFTPPGQHLLKNMGLWMMESHTGLPTWLDSFRIEDFFQNTSPGTSLFVDVGGSIGHQCVSLRTKFPELPGRVILQDQAMVLQQAIPHAGVEAMAHDFWTEQPIKGARVYYFRYILHDYADDMCVKLLKTTMDAMDGDSVILLDEMVLPNKGVHWQATQLDITMMSVLASMERTEKQWYTLLDAAGLRVRNIYRYTPELNDSIIVVVPK